MTAAALLACSGDSKVPASGDPTVAPFDRAIAHAVAGDDDRALNALRDALLANPASVQRALLEDAFDSGLRDQPEFREAIHDAAVLHGVSSLRLVSSDEPGDWIDIEVRAIDAHGAPVPGTVARVYSTDAEGRYHPETEGERTPRIFGTLVADGDGRFTFGIVRPGPYPGTRNARHIHLFASAHDLRLDAPIDTSRPRLRMREDRPRVVADHRHRDVIETPAATERPPRLSVRFVAELTESPFGPTLSLAEVGRAREARPVDVAHPAEVFHHL